MVVPAVEAVEAVACVDELPLPAAAAFAEPDDEHAARFSATRLTPRATPRVERSLNMVGPFETWDASTSLQWAAVTSR
jgi:hypothetical protein